MNICTHPTSPHYDCYYLWHAAAYPQKSRNMMYSRDNWSMLCTIYASCYSWFVWGMSVLRFLRVRNNIISGLFRGANASPQHDSVCFSTLEEKCMHSTAYILICMYLKVKTISMRVACSSLSLSWISLHWSQRDENQSLWEIFSLKNYFKELGDLINILPMSA